MQLLIQLSLLSWLLTGFVATKPELPITSTTENETACMCDRTRDSLALVALYNATDGDNWTRNSNWLSDQGLSEWFGVETNIDGCVDALNLNRNSLNGTIPVELGSLQNLMTLLLSNNSLSGEIPKELGNLGNLTGLYLSRNQLESTIPIELQNLTKLTVLDLRINNISGTIPAELGNLVDLTGLFLNSNDLEGRVPVELGNLSKLRTLELGTNKLSGSIPVELGDLENLTRLSISFNQLSGNIPRELGNLSNLTELYLSDNELNGIIPIELGNLSSLTRLTLAGNEISGSIPAELGNLVGLTDLWIQYNELSGVIPIELGKLVNLTWLNLTGNELSGEIPTELENLSNLNRLYLSENQLSGNIPKELSNLVNLTRIRLDDNQLNGSIPIEFGDLSNLEELDLSNNELNGSIPVKLENLSNLTSLILYDNQLDGTIPPELGNLQNLITLSLAINRLRGTIPPELGNLTNLTWLAIFDNQLDGTIPPELGNLQNLTELSISSNELSGVIPLELQNLVNLTSLYLYDNTLTGEIPPYLGTLSNLVRLYLHNNDLTGCFDNNLLAYCELGFNSDETRFNHDEGYNFSNNPQLPWQGDFERFCNGEEQIGEPCDDGNPNTENDQIRADCSCQGEVEPLRVRIVSYTDESCDRLDDGTITFEVSGGVPPFAYELVDEANWGVRFGDLTSENSSLTFTDLEPGDYQVILVDSNITQNMLGVVVISDTITIEEGIRIGVNIQLQSGLECAGLANGIIQANVSENGFAINDISDYLIEWRTNGMLVGTGEFLNNAAAGVTYEVTVSKDACSRTTTASFTTPPPLNLDIQNLDNATCDGVGDGSIAIDVSGGTTTQTDMYQVQWSNQNATVEIPSLNPAQQGGLTSGNYTITVMDDNGCQDSIAFEIGAERSIAVNSTVSDVSCFGGEDGSIEVNAFAQGIGEQLPYEFTWTAVSSIVPINGEASSTINGLEAGTYQLLVQDADGCAVADTITVPQPDSLIFASIQIDELSCTEDNIGAISIDAAGGVGDYQYLWNTGATTNNISNLSAGIYTVAIIDGNTCTIAETFMISENGFSTTNLSETTCIPAEAGIFTDTLVSFAGCDSIVIREVSLEAAELANAGTAINVCIDDYVELAANQPPNTTGRWLSNFSLLEDVNDPNSAFLATNSSGNYELIWTLSTTNCSDYSTDTVSISIGNAPNARDDTYQLVYPQLLITDLSENDALNANSWTVRLVEAPRAGKVELLDTQGQIRYIPSQYVNDVRFVYEICADGCPDVCDQATVYIEFPDTEGKLTNEGFTPNDDGKNDTFVIPELRDFPDEYPNNEVTVFNRWGDIVFQQNNYQNDWRGYHQSTNKPLPAATYYYIIRLKLADRIIRYGQVTIIR